MKVKSEQLLNLGRKCVGIGILTYGTQQIIFKDFRPVMLPPWPTWRIGMASFWIYSVGFILLGAGAAILMNRSVRKVCLVMGSIMLFIVVAWHLPYMLFINPYNHHLGVWADASKLGAIAGGAFIVAETFSNNDDKSHVFQLLSKITFLGKYFFCFTMITFGIDHFLYAPHISTLVPSWIPGGMFWTYFAGVALIGAGSAIALNIQASKIALLLALMIFLWFVVLHLPRAIADPFVANGNEIASAADALCFSATALLISIIKSKGKTFAT